MRITRLAAAATVLGVALAAPAWADGPRPSSSNAIFRDGQLQPSAQPAAAPHYRWQYHYVGRHARLEGYWALVR
jgi:hypothetical protein